MDVAVENGFFSGEFRDILLREGDVDFFLIARFHANESFLETRNEGMGAELEGVILGLAAVEGFAVDETLEIEDDGVAFFGFAFNDRKLGGSGKTLGDGIGDLFFGNGNDGALLFDSGVSAKGDFRHGRDRENEGEFLVRDLADIHAGAIERLDVFLVEDARISRGEDFVQGGVHDAGRIDMGHGHGFGGLARAETLN